MKLTLNKETLMVLTGTPLRRVAGGFPTEPMDSFDYSCSDLPQCPTRGQFCDPNYTDHGKGLGVRPISAPSGRPSC